MDDARRLALGHLGAQLAKELDARLLTAIEGRIGGVDNMGALRGRLTCVVSPESSVETFYLDGAPLMDVWPIELTHCGNTLTATRKMRAHSVCAKS